MLISIIIFSNIFIFAYAAETYGCKNGTVNLNMNEIGFFETTNFPIFMSADEQDQCDLEFFIENETNKSVKMIMVIHQIPARSYNEYEGYATLFSVRDINSSYSIQSDFNSDGSSIAEQGFVAFFDDLDSCPLEFLCKEKPFKLLYENQILFIRSNYVFFHARQRPCKWIFSAPDGYGFKVVVEILNISSTTSLKIENSTDIIANERSIKSSHGYYNSDNFIQISLTKGEPNYKPFIEFQAYISIIKQGQEKKTVSCDVLTHHYNIIRWSNHINKTGYENNIQCFYGLILPPKSVVFVSFGDIAGDIELGIDDVTYLETQSNNGWTFISYDDDLIIENFNEFDDKHILWKFASDGSVQFSGFTIDFEVIFCDCSLKAVKCDSQLNNLMVITNPNVYTSYYCGNLRCNITIEKCSTSLTLIQFYTNTSVSNTDIFQISSNNRTVYEILNWDYDTHVSFLSSSAENIFQVITTSSSKQNTLSFSVKEFQAPKQKEIRISEKDLFVIIDIDSNLVTTVEISSEFKNQFFIIYSPYPHLIGMYTDSSLLTPIKYWTKNPLNSTCNKCVLKRNKFAVFKLSTIELLDPMLNHVFSTFLAIKLSKSETNCVFEETIFYTNMRPILHISVLSNMNGPCLFTILTDNFYIIKYLWTSSKNENVKIFVGIDQTKLFFEFNSKTAKSWKHIFLFSPVYSVLIPPSTAILIALEVIQEYYYYQNLTKIAEHPYQYLIASPYYGFTKNLYNTNNGVFAVFEVHDYPVMFTVIDYTSKSMENFLFVTKSGKKIFINKTGECVVFRNQVIFLSYQSKITYPGDGIILLMQTYNGTQCL